jgi:hypothetical protein
MTQGSKAAAERTEVLINVNSELFGNSGALRVGDYKLMINPDPSESTIYMQVKAHMQAQTLELTPAEVVSYAKTQTKIIVNGKRHLYNVVLNVAEADVTDGCANVEACTNLAGNPDFAEIESELIEKFEAYKVAAASSTFAWQDDGAIANPMFFNNLWSPWRDTEGAPKVVYTGLLNSADDSSASYDWGAAAAAAASAACDATKASASCARGMLSLSQSSLGEVLTALAVGAGVLALVSFGAFRAGQRRGLGPIPSESRTDGGAKYAPVADLDDFLENSESVDRKEGPLLF